MFGSYSGIHIPPSYTIHTCPWILCHSWLILKCWKCVSWVSPRVCAIHAWSRRQKICSKWWLYPARNINKSKSRSNPLQFVGWQFTNWEVYWTSNRGLAALKRWWHYPSTAEIHRQVILRKRWSFHARFWRVFPVQISSTIVSTVFLGWPVTLGCAWT